MFPGTKYQTIPLRSCSRFLRPMADCEPILKKKPRCNGSGVTNCLQPQSHPNTQWYDCSPVLGGVAFFVVGPVSYSIFACGSVTCHWNCMCHISSSECWWFCTWLTHKSPNSLKMMFSSTSHILIFQDIQIGVFHLTPTAYLDCRPSAPVQTWHALGAETAGHVNREKYFHGNLRSPWNFLKIWPY